MKISKIYPKEWMAVHPYKQTTSDDLYYTDIANQVYQVCKQTGFSEIGMSDEQVRSISVRMTAYFEDVISGLNIWHSFITDYKQHFGKYLPFFTTDIDYYDDEVNTQDIRFLLWHFTQQYFGRQHEAFVNPDNPLLQMVAVEISKIFDAHWEYAPENTMFKALFSSTTRYQTIEDYDNVLFWMHYNSYLMVNSEEEVVNLFSDYAKNTSDQEESYDKYVELRYAMAHYGRTPFMAHTTPWWMSRVFPEDHPDYPLFKACADRYDASEDKASKIDPDSAKALYDKFMALSGGNLFVYVSSKEELEDILSNKLGLKDFSMEEEKKLFKEKCAISALPDSGIQIISTGIDCIKDSKNPFYNEQAAQSGAVLFFTHTLCQYDILEKMQEQGMLIDAHLNSNVGPERGKAIIQDDWQFIASYFQRLRKGD